MTYGSRAFLLLLHEAQDGSQLAKDAVVLASLPIIYQLTQDEDEVQELIVWLYERVIPRWTEVHWWGGHAKRLLVWRLMDLRKKEDRRRKRGL